MATSPLDASGASVTPHTASIPMPPVARALATFDRDQIGSAIEVLIALLDVAEPDPDLEDTNDQEAGDGDDRGDQAWIEWTTMRAADKRRGQNLLAGEEDAEEDDGDTGVEDDPLGIDPESDHGAEEQGEPDEDEILVPSYGTDQSKGPLPFTMSIDRILMQPFRDRIRQTRCDKLTYGGTNGGYRMTEYRLRYGG